MSKILAPGMIAGVLAMAGGLSVAFGKPALGAFLSDPSTAVAATALVSGAVGLVAGVMRGWSAPAA